MSTDQHCLLGRRLHYPGCQTYGGPKGAITNQFPKTQISLPKHKPISQNTNQFTKTETNFPKHKSVYQNTNQFPKTKISLPKHKTISQNKNQFTKTQNNFPKHKSVCQNTKQFLKTQISLLKHKRTSQNTNQFTKTQNNFSKHKSKYWALVPWLSERAWKELIPRIFRVQYSDFYSVVEVFTKMFCHNCGSELLEEYLYCSPCGKKLIHKTLLTTRSQKRSFKKGHKPSCSLGQWKLTNTDLGLSRIVYGKCNSIPFEINTTMYLQTKRFIRSTERNKRNKLLC